ncbi:MAG: RsmB/NOP family class I SAM-dependent RNA methyltransferase [Puniceicoccaceae bacterium]
MGLEQQASEWRSAIELLLQWDRGDRHLDDLLEKYNIGKLRWLVIESFRTRPVVDRILDGKMSRKPRPKVLHILRLAVTEILNRGSDKHPAIVNSAVAMAKELGVSKPEVGFINGVLRSILRAPDDQEYSLDETVAPWLLSRWRRQFGAEALALLLEWNSRVPEITIRGLDCPEYATSTEWNGFFRIQDGRFSDAIKDLESGLFYVQDPFTRIPVELLEVQPGETILDLCAAPGGKSRWLLENMEGKGRLVAIDRPGARLKRLERNLQAVSSQNASVIGADVLRMETEMKAAGIRPGSVDAVLIDVPCSNTGVIQKRPDVKLRLVKEDIQQQADMQLSLLDAAAQWPRTGGRLVYSTCSLEEEENSGVVSSFLQLHPDWELKESVLSLPWMCGHDGGGAFLLTKSQQA